MVRRFGWIWLLVLAGGCATPGRLGDAGQIAAAVASTERPAADLQRDVGRRPAAVLSFAGVRPGERIYEFAAGGGYYTELLVRVVGDGGRVFVEGIDPYAWQQRAAARLPQVRLVGPGAEPRAIDLVFTALNYHDLVNIDGDRAALLARFHRMLRPGGRLVIIDHSAAPGATVEQAAALHRVPESLVRAEARASGFRLAASSDLLRNPSDSRSQSVFDADVRGRTDRFLLLFEKPREAPR